MHLLNFSHPLTSTQLEDISHSLGEAIEHVYTIPVQFDTEQPFTQQLLAHLESAKITSEDFQTLAWVVVLPSLNVIASVVIAELHGRIGHFPAVVRLRPSQASAVTTYEFAEVIDLDRVRQEARKHRR